MATIQERGSTHVYKVNKISKEEINEMASRCSYEDPPFCAAACPLKLDTKAMLNAIKQRDMKKALLLYEKIAPFPIILSSGCEAPCESKCRICEKGDGIAIRDIEAAVAKYGEKSKSGGVFRMRKNKTVAVFGSGIFCLFLAGELEKKAYPLTLFCEEADMSAFLAKETSFLADWQQEAELVRLAEKEINFVFDCVITPEFFAEKRKEFDVICASQKIAQRIFPEAVCNSTYMLYEAEKLVVGFGNSVMDAAFGAKKAALTVDRLAQNLDAGNTRGEEGPCESRLFTDLSTVQALSRVQKTGDGYTKEEAIEEAGRCIQCSCDECFKGCAYLRHYKKHPALLAREIYNNTQIIMGDHQLNKPMNACALCEQCTVTCPNGFDMARVCKLAKENMVSTDKMPLAPHEFALMDMYFSNGEAFLCKNQPGYKRCMYVFFPGCQAAAIAPDTVKAAYLDLCRRLPGGVALMLGCCGAISDWAGRGEMYEGVKAFLDEKFGKLKNPIIIAGCPTCKKELGEHDCTDVIGIWDVLNDIGLPPEAVKPDMPVALHDSCGARGDESTHIAIRQLAEKLGCELVETAYSGDASPCCGYGGLTSYANREVAKEMTESCLSRSDAPYISYCMACRDRFAREGRESKHILELVYGTNAGAPPDISERRYNRLTLKNTLLCELWGEETKKVQLPYKVEFAKEARKMMDDRMILTEDVLEVIKAAHDSGEMVENAETGYLSARKRCGNVTFWVDFTEKDGGYLVHRAYSHRMNVIKRQG